MRRSAGITAVALLLMSAIATARAENRWGEGDIVVAVIDTGIRATHQEFDYRGRTDPDDQFVGWWDFTDARGPSHIPSLGEKWDPIVLEPYDDVGHGTQTASAAVGRNMVGPASKDPSFAPGAKLAVAKVCKAGGLLGSTCDGNFGAAVRWAIDIVHADVITISIGALVMGAPSVSASDAFRHAREVGTLVTVSNGNGNANAGVPGHMGWASTFGNSPSVLSIGVAESTSSTFNSYTATTDAEVTAKANGVRMASRSCDTCYNSGTGTSFSNPTVAGMAAKLMEIARANGHPATPEYVERLLKYSAIDTLAPPMFEGYGQLNATAFTSATQHAAAGTLPARPTPDPSGLYVESVSGTLKDVWNNRGSAAVYGFAPTGVAAPTGPGSIGPGALGVVEGERYEIALSAGEDITVSLDYAPLDPLLSSRQDVNLYVYSTRDPVLLIGEAEGFSRGAAGEAEQVSFTSAQGGDYTILVVGTTIARPQGVALTTSTSDSATPEAVFVSEGYYTVSPYGA